jgi:hypothetical protein
MRRNQTLCFGEVHRFLDGLFDGDLHAKRILSLTNATLGVIKTASLAVNTIGQGLALARGLVTKHAIKQVDRLLGTRPSQALKSRPFAKAEPSPTAAIMAVAVSGPTPGTPCNRLQLSS